MDLHGRILKMLSRVGLLFNWVIPIGSKVAPFCGLYLGSYKAIPKKELLWSLWVVAPSRKGLGTDHPSAKGVYRV